MDRIDTQQTKQNSKKYNFIIKSTEKVKSTKDLKKNESNVAKIKSSQIAQLIPDEAENILDDADEMKDIDEGV